MWAAPVILLCALVAALPARAQPEPVSLAWHAPMGCSSARDVLDRVQRLTAGARLSDRQLRAEATIARRARGQLHLKLVVQAGALVGERDIDARTCADLAGAAAVVLALLLKSELPLRDDELGSGTQTGVDSPPSPRVTSTSDRAEQARASASEAGMDDDSARVAAQPEHLGAQEVARRAQRRWHGLLQLPVVSLGVGPVPGASFGLSFAAGFSFERWSLLAESGAWLKQTLQAVDQPDAGADVHRLEAAVRGCRAIPLGRLEVSACLRAAFQHIWARGTGAHVAPETAQASWFAAGCGFQAHYQVIHRLRVFGRLDAHIEAARPHLTIDGVGGLGQLWPAALTISVGSEWIL